MLQYLRIWRQFVVMAFVREAEYRVNFLLSVGEGIVQLVVAVLTFDILYRFTDDVAGWSRAEVLLLVGIYRIVEGLSNLQIAPNMQSIWEYIRKGELDFMLLRPVSSQFMVSARRLQPHEAINALIGLGLAIYAGNMAGVRWSALVVVEAAIFGFCGLLLLYAVWFLTITALFWTQAGNQDEIIPSLFQTARYPASFFKGVIRTLLTFVIPAAFATTFPAQALLGQADRQMLVVGIGLAAAALLATHLCWNYALRRYTSASS
jgi:ABC-2 type transport system permease protein